MLRKCLSRVVDSLPDQQYNIKIYKKHANTNQEIRTAVKLHLPGEVSKHTVSEAVTFPVSEGTKAVTKYTTASKI